MFSLRKPHTTVSFATSAASSRILRERERERREGSEGHKRRDRSAGEEEGCRAGEEPKLGAHLSAL